MTQRLLAAFVLALTVFVSGCYVSLHPLVTKDVQVYEPGLLGAWEEKDAANKDLWVFKPGPGGKPDGYVVEVTEQHSAPLSTGPVTPLTAVFAGRLGRFGDLLVLEITPDDEQAFGALKDHGLLTSSMVPAQTFFRVRLEAGSLTLMAVDGNWMDKAIASKTVKIAHEHLGDEPNPHEAGQRDLHSPRHADETSWVLLTAPTSQLQALVRRHGKAGLFDEKDAGEFVRRQQAF